MALIDPASIYPSGWESDDTPHPACPQLSMFFVGARESDIHKINIHKALTPKFRKFKLAALVSIPNPEGNFEGNPAGAYDVEVAGKDFSIERDIHSDSPLLGKFQLRNDRLHALSLFNVMAKNHGLLKLVVKVTDNTSTTPRVESSFMCSINI